MPLKCALNMYQLVAKPYDEKRVCRFLRMLWLQIVIFIVTKQVSSRGMHIAPLCYFIHVSRDIIMLVLKQGETLQRYIDIWSPVTFRCTQEIVLVISHSYGALINRQIFKTLQLAMWLLKAELSAHGWHVSHRFPLVFVLLFCGGNCSFPSTVCMSPRT